MKNLPLITSKGSVRNEPKVTAYVQHMLASVGLSDVSFTLAICKKIPSGGSHHEGVEVRNNESTGVRLYVQYGDNGTRFECYLSSKEIRPKQLHVLLSSKLKDCHYVMERVIPQKIALSKTPPISGAFVPCVPPVQSENQPKVNDNTSVATLKGLSQDAEAMQLIILGLNTEHGEKSFTQFDFHSIVQKSINSNASQAHSGQLIRRMTQLGYIIKLSEGNPRIKIYRLAPAHVAIPKVETPPVPQTEQTATPPSPIEHPNVVARKIEDLVKKMAEITSIEAQLRETQVQIEASLEEIDSIEARLKIAKARLADLQKIEIIHANKLNETEYVLAKHDFEAISRLLASS